MASAHFMQLARGKFGKQKIEELLAAAENGQVKKVEALLASGLPMDITDDAQQRTALHAAAAKGQTAVIQLLTQRNVFPYVLDRISNNADANVPDSMGLRPLHLAALGGHVDATKALLAVHASVVVVDNISLATPLHVAAERGNAPIVELLCAAKGVNLNSPDKFQMTPLHVAALNSHANPATLENRAVAARVLIAKGAGINTTNICEETPLHIAAKEDSVAVVQLLCEQPNIDLGARNHQGKTPLECAPERSVSKSLLEKAQEVRTSVSQSQNGAAKINTAIIMVRLDGPANRNVFVSDEL